MGRDMDEGRTLSTPLCKPPTNQKAWVQDLTQLCTVTTNIIWFEDFTPKQPQKVTSKEPHFVQPASTWQLSIHFTP